jgi:4-hydroxybenzoate polyprenyltransferase
MLIYIIPSVIFVAIFLALYYKENSKDPKEEKNIIKCFLPALMVGGIVFAVMKYKEQSAEPVMTGNYFDPI